MTVCIAAICEFPVGGRGIIACSDRMITSGATEFQPEQAKYYSFPTVTDRTIALVAGAVSSQIAVCDNTYRELLAAPTPLTRIIAATYADQFAAYQRELAVQEVLSVYDLTHETFLEKQHLMSADFIRRIEAKIEAISVGTETIIAGTDEEGVHLYAIRDRSHLTGSDAPGIMRCETVGGFAAIGIGAVHAESRFTTANYGRSWSIARALNLLFSARRGAEAAPGVGDAADWYVITPGGTATMLKDSIVEHLAEEHKRYQGETTALRAARDERTTAFLQEITKARVEAATAQIGEAPSPAPARPEGSPPGQPPQPPSQG